MSDRIKLGPENFLTAFAIVPVDDWSLVDDRIRYEFTLETEGKKYYVPWAMLAPWNVPSFRTELDLTQRILMHLTRGMDVYCPHCEAYCHYSAQGLWKVGEFYNFHLDCRVTP